MNIPENILCSKSHEFLQDNGDNTYTIGLTDYAIEQLGDIVFLELPEVGNEFAKGDTSPSVGTSSGFSTGVSTSVGGTGGCS